MQRAFDRSENSSSPWRVELYCRFKMWCWVFLRSDRASDETKREIWANSRLRIKKCNTILLTAYYYRLMVLRQATMLLLLWLPLVNKKERKKIWTCSIKALYMLATSEKLDKLRRIENNFSKITSNRQTNWLAIEKRSEFLNN